MGFHSTPLSWDIDWPGHTITGYDVLVDGVLRGSPASSPYTISGLEDGTLYQFAVRPRDASSVGPIHEISHHLPAASGHYGFPADRLTHWNPGLMAVGGIPDRSGNTIYQTLAPGPSTTIAAGSNGMDLATFRSGAGTLFVASTAGFPTTGELMVLNAGGRAAVTYTGISGASFTGCSALYGAEGLLSTGGDVNASDTDRIQAVLDACPPDQVVQLTGGVFYITEQGLGIFNNRVTLRGIGPGPSHLAPGVAPKPTRTDGTYLVKPGGTVYPVVIIGPRYGGTSLTVNLTANALRGSNFCTVTDVTGLSAGDLVVVHSITNPNVSHWNEYDDYYGGPRTGWFSYADRPLGQVMEIVSINGNTVTFNTPFHITHQVEWGAQLSRLANQVEYSGVEDLFCYGGDGGDGGGGVHMWNCKYCWFKHLEVTWQYGGAAYADACFRCELRDNYFHHSSAGMIHGGGAYGMGFDWYTSDSLMENNISIIFNKCFVMRAAGGGNVIAYNYVDDGTDLYGTYTETVLNTSHTCGTNYCLVEGNEASNFDQDDRWGNSVYITIFRNALNGQSRDYAGVFPFRAAGCTQWHWWQNFVGNVLGRPVQPNINTYEVVGGNINDFGRIWAWCYQSSDALNTGGVGFVSNPYHGFRSNALNLRDGNFDYYTYAIHWHGIGGTSDAAGSIGLTPPADTEIPDSLYLPGKPAFFGTRLWPWVDGTDSENPLPGRLPARSRYDAGTPNDLS